MSLSRTCTWCPRLFALFVAVSLVEALAPALSVVAVNWFVTQFSHDRGESWTIFVLALVLGLGHVSGDARSVLGSMLAAKIVAFGHGQLAQTMSRMDEQRLARADVSLRARETRDSIYTKLGRFPAAVIQAGVGGVSVIALLCALWPLDWRASLALFGALVAQVPFLSKMSAIEGAMYPLRAEQERRADYFMHQLTYQSSASELVGLGSAGWVAEKCFERHLRACSVYLRTMSQSLLLSAASGLCAAVLSGVALFFVTQSSGGSTGALAAGIVAIIASANSVFSAGMSVGEVVAASVPVGKALDFLSCARESPMVAQDAERPGAQGSRLDAQSLSFTYPSLDRRAVNDVSLSGQAGDVIAIVGENGSGKTTLLKLLTGVYSPDAGKVSLDGCPLDSLPSAERRRQFGLLVQDFGRYELTVRECVTLGVIGRAVSDEEIWEALSVARADDFVKGLPHGLDTQLGEQWGGVGLSGGQWQRLAIARVALRESPVWILDEPTSAVDAATEEEIIDGLLRNRGGHLTILVSHRAWSLKNVDKIYVMKSGEIVQSGSYEALISADGEFLRLFDSQVSS